MRNMSELFEYCWFTSPKYNKASLQSSMLSKDGKSMPFAPRSPDYLNPPSPIFNDPCLPNQIDPQEVLNFI